MNFMTIKDASDRWGITPRRISTLCNKGRIDGAVKASGVWILPADAQKPEDARMKNGIYVGWREKINLAENDYVQNLKNVEATFHMEGMRLSPAAKKNMITLC